VVAVTIFIPATEALAKIVVVVVLVYIIAGVAVVSILIGIGVLVVGEPPILSVRLSGSKAFLITVVHGLPEQICTVSIDLIVAAATIITIDRSSVEVRITVVVVVALVLDACLLPTQALQILFLKPVLRYAPLLL